MPKPPLRTPPVALPYRWLVLGSFVVLAGLAASFSWQFMGPPAMASAGAPPPDRRASVPVQPLALPSGASSSGGLPAAATPGGSQQFMPLLSIAPTPTPTLVPLPPATATPSGIRASDLGLVWVNSAENLSDNARIQRGVSTGARLDRFPLYWNEIEAQAGQFQWGGQDKALLADEAQGLGALPILLGEPAAYYPTGAPAVTLPRVGGSFLRYGPGAGARGAAAASCHAELFGGRPAGPA